MTTYEWLSLICVLIGGFYMLNNRLSSIEAALVGKVGYHACDERREKCPCVEDIKEIKEELKK